MLFVPPRHGKLCADSEIIPTPTGWKRHGDLRPGDHVFGGDGRPVEVLAVSAPDLASLRVRFTDGSSVVCHPAHEWTVYERNRHRWRTIETRELAKYQLLSGSKKPRATYQLPLRPALQYPAADLPMHPYVLGAWLGDGTSTAPCITHDPRETEVITAITACGYAVSAVNTHRTTGVLTTSFGGRRGVKGLMRSHLDAAGVFLNKHIPGAYKLGSIEQRLELLAGLIDTDGHVDKNSRVRIVTGSKVLAEDIAEVVRSLGWHSCISEAQPTLSSSGIQGRRVVYTVGFQPDRTIPTKLPRKAIKRFVARRRVGIASIEQAAPEIGRCIQVNATDGLYVVGKDCIVTHNSELASKRFPAWYLGHNPHDQLISVSASADLAADFGRDVRNILISSEYKALFKTTLAEDSQAKDKWHTNDGGIYYSVGIGGNVLGRGGDVVLIDDPFGTMADAQSPAQRKKVWDWFTGTIYNRLMPNGAIILIAHRMHEEDLAGKILAAGGDKWTVVQLPAIDEEGQALWPENYPLDYLERVKANSQPRFWSALYQQNPIPDEGDYFKSDWIKTVPSLPPRHTMNFYGGSDYAVSADRGDFTVHAVIGLDSDKRMYLVDIWRRQASSDKWIEAWCDLVCYWKPVFWAEERGQIISGVGPFLEQRAIERAAWTAREQFSTHRGDKAVRAQSMRGRMAMSGLHVLENAPFLAELKAELLAFPAGRHDDQVDALGLIGQLFDRVSAGVTPIARKERRGISDSYRAIQDDIKDDRFLTL
jgi:predicted phage terminase large subunit-like protein